MHCRHIADIHYWTLPTYSVLTLLELYRWTCIALWVATPQEGPVAPTSIEHADPRKVFRRRQRKRGGLHAGKKLVLADHHYPGSS